MKTAVVLGGHGFIGHHMARRLKKEGYWVRTVDIKEFPYGDLESDVDDYIVEDLRDINICENILKAPGNKPFNEVYQFSAWMGGAQVIFSGDNDARVMHDSALLNINIAEVCKDIRPEKIFYSSSACVYNQLNQEVTDNPITAESSVFPAYPDSAYGWEKIFSELLWDSYARNHGLNVKIARFHNVFGECFDEETEILTNDGFKFFKDVSFKDIFATRNPETGEVEYQSALAIQNFSYKGDMYKITTSDIDMLITPNHSTYVSTRTTKTKDGIMENVEAPFQLKKIKDIVHNRIKFRSDFNWEGCNSIEFFKLPDIYMKDGRKIQSGKGLEKNIPIGLFLEFLGWYISEGSCFETPSNYTVAITQSYKNKKNIKDIISCIKQMGFSCKYDGKSVIVSSKQLWNYCKQFGHCRDKFIPKEFLNLPKDKLKYLITSLMKGDGDRRFFTDTSFRYSTASCQLASDIQELLYKLGYQAWIKKETIENYNSPTGFYEKTCVIYRIHGCKSTIHTIKRKHINIINYCGSVYDITVPNHIIFIRRKGKCVWSGNCGAWGNGREKSPAAMCRKIAETSDGGTIEVFGDGNQTRSFLYIDECLEGVRRLMESNFSGPVNIGSDEMVSINQLVEMVKGIAGKPGIKIKHIVGPLGVRGRNSDNNLIKEKIGWAPDYPLIEGLKKTYPWIEEQVKSEKKDYPWSN